MIRGYCETNTKKEREVWCGMKEYKEAEKQAEKIKESEDVGELERFFSKDHMTFQSLVKKWFQPSPTSESCDPPSREYDLEEILRYVDLAIQMHQKAIAHHALKNINLIFSSTWNGRIEPQIHLEFDTASVNVVIDELWESELELDRDMKEECVCAAGDVWGEYRPTIDTAQLCKDAEDLCAQLHLRYPAAAVSYSLC